MTQIAYERLEKSRRRAKVFSIILLIFSIIILSFMGYYLVSMGWSTLGQFSHAERDSNNVPVPIDIDDLQCNATNSNESSGLIMSKFLLLKHHLHQHLHRCQNNDESQSTLLLMGMMFVDIASYTSQLISAIMLYFVTQKDVTPNEGIPRLASHHKNQVFLLGIDLTLFGFVCAMNLNPEQQDVFTQPICLTFLLLVVFMLAFIDSIMLRIVGLIRISQFYNELLYSVENGAGAKVAVATGKSILIA